MNLGFWRDISVVLLVLEAFVLTLLAGVVLYFLGRGVTILLREIPNFFTRIREVQASILSTVSRITDRIVAPAFAAAQFIARLRGIAAGIRKLVIPR